MVNYLQRKIVPFLCAAGLSLAQMQQVNDPDFVAKVERPAFRTKHPRVGIDEAHRNFHTRDNRYKPFAGLLASDGFAVAAAPRFAADSLGNTDVLVVANAAGEMQGGRMGPAFTPAECDAVHDWVRAGGSLLLIADHAPFGDASAALAQRFGVEMGRGFVMDPKNADGNPTRLVFTRENGLIGEHAILQGRGSSERVRKIVAFTGQSLSVPAGAAALMKLADSATETNDPADQAKVASGIPAGRRLEGRAMAVALAPGQGRVVVMGEGAMFSAQIVTINGQSFKAGMNVPGNDDRQFALNAMRWLARAID